MDNYEYRKIFDQSLDSSVVLKKSSKLSPLKSRIVNTQNLLSLTPNFISNLSNNVGTTSLK